MSRGWGPEAVQDVDAVLDEMLYHQPPKKKRARSNLPIPHFTSIRETVNDLDSIVLIAPDHSAGCKHRYSVIRIRRKTGRATCIGRELNLKLARIVASRPVGQDGKPVK